MMLVKIKGKNSSPKWFIYHAMVSRVVVVAPPRMFLASGQCVWRKMFSSRTGNDENSCGVCGCVCMCVWDIVSAVLREDILTYLIIK